ncbi:MAG TPA: MASE1 domain-containing protein [Burkholderiaceae bacterium]|nr:MASE1 domain-containing protein [Burkholderiaceae bacterium]
MPGWRSDRREGAFGRLFVLSAAFIPLYVLIDALMYLLPRTPFTATPWNPHPALAVALMTAGGARYAPAVLIALLAAEFWVRDAPGTDLGTTLACVGMAAAYFLAAMMMRRLAPAHWSDANVREVAEFVAVAAAGTLLAGVLYVGAYVMDGTLEREEAATVLQYLWIGDLLGLVVLAPLLLLLADGAWRRWRRLAPAERAVALRDTVLLIAALTALLVLVFAVKPFDEFRMSYLLFLPMIAFALRYGLVGAALALPCAQIGVVLALSVSGDTLATPAFEFQLLILTLAITTLVFGALATERLRSAEMLAARERELRSQQAALSQAQRSASAAELAAALAHELNQPLSAIGTYASACRVLAAHEGNREQLLDALSRVTEESTRAGQFVRRMRDFFRTGAAHAEVASVAGLVNAAHDQVADRMARFGITWRTALAAGLPDLVVDRVQIGAVLSNLLNNAIDALAGHAPPREIEVRALRSERKVRIEVRDSGSGVAAEVRDRLFQPMATSKPEGMGLGLAIARTIAEQHGGRLWLEEGAAQTTFCLELPIDSSHDH